MVSFSVAMGTYNGAAYLGQQLESLLEQDIAPVELVVGDDGSSDGTLTILEDFSSRAPFPVHVTCNPKQLGYGENFLQAASRCTGDWIAFCDQDDVWLPTKLRRCAHEIATGPPDLGLVIHGALIADAQLRTISRTYWPEPGVYGRLVLPPNFFVQGFREVIRRSLLHEIPFENRGIPWIGEPEAHDVWVYLVAVVTGSVAVIDDDLVIYRRHETNTTEVNGLARGTLVQRMKQKLRDKSADYREQAVVYRAISTYLAERATNQLTPERAHQFLSAAAQVRALADRWGTRAEINSDSSFRKRLHAYVRLARTGGYRSKKEQGFGTPDAAADLMRVILPYH